ncbi:MAG: UDP-N-acetylmuramoyl-L-alanine--D-glutamate ligase [Patescibacteria group bacterium]
MGYKNIIILGFGIEGKSAFSYLKKKYPKAAFAIADKNKIDSSFRGRTFTGKNYLKNIGGYDLIVKSPGISLREKDIAKAVKKGARLTSATELFFEACRGKIIGVTGTKGKSTTSTLIYEILKKAKIKSSLVGNIGNPPLDFLDKNSGKGKIFVYELSSYQLNDLKKSPWIAVFLNIFPDHMPYHGSFKNYQKAKANIVKFQGGDGCFIYNSDYRFLANLAKSAKGRAVSYTKTCSAKNGAVYYKNEKIISQKDIKLLGKHNLENIFACITAAKILKVSNTVIREAIKNFKGLPHRLELARVYKGIKFYDDAISTTPESTIAAIEVFGDNLGTIILGGENRGYNFSRLAKIILKYRVKNVVLFPDSGAKIWKEIVKACRARGEKLPLKLETKKMSQAVKFAYKNTEEGKVCLLSTASPSYSIFKNFIDKGNQFKKEVKKLK